MPLLDLQAKLIKGKYIGSVRIAEWSQNAQHYMFRYKSAQTGRETRQEALEDAEVLAKKIIRENKSLKFEVGRPKDMVRSKDQDVRYLDNFFRRLK
jgi:ribosomal protein L16/L10AE